MYLYNQQQMKNSLLILSLIILWMSFTWCQKQENIEACSSTNGSCTNTKEYQDWEQLCIDNDGEVTTDELWNDICLFNAHDWCLLKNIEDWNCEWIIEQQIRTEYPDPVNICEYNGWKIIYDEEKEWPMCYFLEAEWCSLASIDRWDCEYLSDEYNYWEEEYPVWEQICIDYNGQISETEDGSKICILNDNDFCYLEDLQDWWCDLLPPQPECSKERDPVCWKDWNTYNNRCLLEAAWIEEETEAEITENWCVFW